MLEQGINPEKVSEGDLHWSGSSLREPLSAEDTHAVWRRSWRIVSCRRDATLSRGRTVRIFFPEER